MFRRNTREASRDNQHMPVAATQRGAWVVELIHLSPMPIPRVRKDALVESLKVESTEDGLCAIFLDALCGSPYIPDYQKQELADVVLAQRWTELPDLVGVHRPVQPKMVTTQHQRTTDLKYLAVQIFRKSRKIRNLPRARRQALGTALLACTQREEVIDLLLQSLERAQTLNWESRLLVADDVLEGNFHRLLLPNRFDCDELPRVVLEAPPASSMGGQQHASAPLDDALDEEREECIICFGPYLNGHSHILPTCGHEFCQDCIQELAATLGSPMPCPICRRESVITTST